MANPLSSYYLQQMGIDVWVERQSAREKELAHLNQSTALSTCGNPDAQLMVIARKPIFDKAALLLSRMLQSIGFDEPDVFIASSDNPELLARQIDLTAPRAVLNLAGVELDTSSFAGTCVTCLHPEHLLQHPKDKKAAFMNLQKLKALARHEV
ncbi:DNA polymerase III subunit psi [Legionella sp. CNM-4043-24]|uniref:DNA polymerase III subunit psi n=1 Tax=Legionella sp. CNM-4043-24 TaxID=3421646 RepID=UPI00403AC202